MVGSDGRKNLKFWSPRLAKKALFYKTEMLFINIISTWKNVSQLCTKVKFLLTEKPKYAPLITENPNKKYQFTDTEDMSKNRKTEKFCLVHRKTEKIKAETEQTEFPYAPH